MAALGAVGRRLLRLQPLPLLAQQALRRAVPPTIPHCRFLGSSFPPAAPASSSPPAPPFPSPSGSGRAGSLLPMSAGAVVAAVPGAGFLGLELSALQRSRATSGWPLSSSSELLLHAAAPWAHWTSTPADDMVFMLLGVNVSVFMLWRVLAYPRFITDPFMISLDTFFGGQLHRLLTSASSLVDPMFMSKHFMLSMDNFTSGRLHTLLTSAFSHIDVQHLFNNMVGLYFFGLSIARMFGPGYLSQLYITGALVGSAFYLAEMIFLAPRKEVFGGWKTPCLGASAAVNATILLEIFLHPTNLVYLHFFVPVPAALVGIGLIGADLWRVKKGKSRVSGSSHLGGALVAAVAFAEIKGWI